MFQNCSPTFAAAVRAFMGDGCGTFWWFLVVERFNFSVWVLLLMLPEDPLMVSVTSATVSSNVLQTGMTAFRPLTSLGAVCRDLFTCSDGCIVVLSDLKKLQKNIIRREHLQVVITLAECGRGEASVSGASTILCVQSCEHFKMNDNHMPPRH